MSLITLVKNNFMNILRSSIKKNEENEKTFLLHGMNLQSSPPSLPFFFLGSLFSAPDVAIRRAEATTRSFISKGLSCTRRNARSRLGTRFREPLRI